MNRFADESQRTVGDFILFALMFAGFVFGSAGLVTASVPACVTGLFLFTVGLACFMLKGA